MSRKSSRNIQRVDYSSMCMNRNTKVYADYRDGRDHKRRKSSILRGIRKQERVEINRKRTLKTMKEDNQCTETNSPPPQKKRKVHKKKCYHKKLKEERERYTLYYRTVNDKIDEIRKEMRSGDITFTDYQHLQKYYVVKLFYNLLSNVANEDVAYFIKKTDVYNVIQKQYGVNKDTITKYVSDFELDCELN